MSNFGVQQTLFDLILDRVGDSITYEVCGEYNEVMYAPDGACLYLVWHFGPKDRTGVRYPKQWESYFCRPVFLLSCPIGKFWLLRLSNKLMYQHKR